jgi:hypothetical protein
MTAVDVQIGARPAAQSPGQPDGMDSYPDGQPRMG